MIEFLSEENIALHTEYIRQKRLKYSIIEGSIPVLSGADVRDIYRLKISARDRKDAVVLLSEIRLHDIFFSSFCHSQYSHSASVSKAFGSEAELLNRIYRKCMGASHGFVLVYVIGDKIELTSTFDYGNVLRSIDPILAIDICEHAYFMDYGFDKERYLLTSLPYLDLSRIAPVKIKQGRE